ncbi:MAG: hypothetical protein GY785_17915 [Gammaproteobacteria bacterium]|nr:hypothetical protein [Gammaproteobacteria bacterium]
MPTPKPEVVNASAGGNPIHNSNERFPLDGLNDLLRVLMEGVDDAEDEADLFAALHQAAALADSGIAAGVAGTGIADFVQGGGTIGGSFIAAQSNLQNTIQDTIIPSQSLTAIDP